MRRHRVVGWEHLQAELHWEGSSGGVGSDCTQPDVRGSGGASNPSSSSACFSSSPLSTKWRGAGGEVGSRRIVSTGGQMNRPLVDIFEYNLWANRTLLEACRDAPEAALRA